MKDIIVLISIRHFLQQLGLYFLHTCRFSESKFDRNIRLFYKTKNANFIQLQHHLAPAYFMVKSNVQLNPFISQNTQ